MERCPFCMCVTLDDGVCRTCGYPEPRVGNRHALPVGTVLQNRFTLGGALQMSFQSIAYTGLDRDADVPVLVTEFYPKHLASRSGLNVQPSKNKELYAKACALYQAAPAPDGFRLVTAFGENDTTYRVFELNGDPAAAAELADGLLDHPVYFREASGKPLMTVNALEMPRLPAPRAYRKHPAGAPAQRTTGVKADGEPETVPAACAVPQPAAYFQLMQEAPNPVDTGRSSGRRQLVIVLLAVLAALAVLVGILFAAGVFSGRTNGQQKTNGQPSMFFGMEEPSRQQGRSFAAGLTDSCQPHGKRGA